MLPYFLLRVISGKEMKEELRTDTTPKQSKELRLRVGTVQMQISPEQLSLQLIFEWEQALMGMSPLLCALSVGLQSKILGTAS